MLLDKLLSGTVKLWLASQLSNVEKLTVKVPAKEKQILQGYIPKVFISVTKAIYQELHLSDIKIQGADIRFNLPQVLKKQPLKLLEPIAVKIEVVLSPQDAQNSLNSPLLQSGLTDIATKLLARNNILCDRQLHSWQWNQIDITESIIGFQGSSKLPSKNSSIQITTKINLVNSQTLLLIPLAVLIDSQSILSTPASVEFDLGNQVTIKQLMITPQQLSIGGNITVFP